MSGFIDSLGNLGVAPSIERLVRQGQAFGGTSGKLALAAAGSAGVALWNPATSGRQVFVYGVQMLADSAVAFGVMATLAADPGWTAAAVHNKHRTSATTPGAALEATATAGAAPAAADTTGMFSLAAGEVLQWTPEIAEALLPPGTGLVIWLPLAGAGNVAVNLDWLEW
ncbi:MAG TPA: hypothetical protein VFU69_01430 [Ktedonobacterales bacterium]|nr:hypothetical protein [Ktedonobacterales bacterium]